MKQIKIIDAKSGQIFECPQNTTMEQMRQHFASMGQTDYMWSAQEEILRRQQATYNAQYQQAMQESLKRYRYKK